MDLRSGLTMGVDELYDTEDDAAGEIFVAGGTFEYTAGL